MKPLYAIIIGESIDLLDQNEFNNFLTTAVMHNKNITSFTVIDITRNPVDMKYVSQIIAIAKVKKNIDIVKGVFLSPKQCMLEF